MGGLCHSYAGSESDDQVERVVMFQSLEFWAFGGEIFISHIFGWWPQASGVVWAGSTK